MGVVIDEVTADISAPAPEAASGDTGASDSESMREQRLKREVLEMIERRRARTLRVRAD